MSRVSKRMLSGILLLVCVLVLGTPRVVHAEIAEELETYLKQQVTVFLEQATLMTDEQLDGMAEEGGFYEVFSRSWKEDRSTVGDLVMIHEPEVDDSDPEEVIVSTVVDYQHYTADVAMYFSGEDLSPKNYVMTIRYSLKEKIQQAAQNMVVGLIVVFAVLLFLMFVIYLFRFIPSGKKKEPSAAASPAQQAPAAQPAKQVPLPADAPEETEEEIAAVIAAAIAAASTEAPSPAGYVVRSVRRKPSAWKRA